jgi:hypothetical protein
MWSTVVEHTTHNPDINGLNPSSRREREIGNLYFTKLLSFDAKMSDNLVLAVAYLVNVTLA